MLHGAGDTVLHTFKAQPGPVFPFGLFLWEAPVSLQAAEPPGAVCRDSTRGCSRTGAATAPSASTAPAHPREHPPAAPPDPAAALQSQRKGQKGSPVPQQACPGEQSPLHGGLPSTQRHRVPGLAGAGTPGKIRLERVFCVPNAAAAALAGESRELISRWQRNFSAAETPAPPCTPCSSCGREAQGQGEAIV